MAAPAPPTPQVQPTETKYVRETVYVTRPSSHHGSQPTKELQEILSKLGTLNERHEKLRELVEKLKVIFILFVFTKKIFCVLYTVCLFFLNEKDELRNKMDKSDKPPAPVVQSLPPLPSTVTVEPPPPSSTFKLPADFSEKIDEIKKIMNMLQELRNSIGIVWKKLDLESNYTQN